VRSHDASYVPGLRKDGSGICIEFTVVSVRDDAGEVAAMAAIMRDVTKRFEEARPLKQKLAEGTKASG
jgi:nitric oxide dioxygenase